MEKIGHGGDEEKEVSADKDLLVQILLFSAPKSLLRFKSVANSWLSLISSRWFRLRKSSRFSKDISGILLMSPKYDRYDFLPLNGDRLNSPGYPAFGRLDFVDGEREGLVVLQSCNGLLLCSSYSRRTLVDVEAKYYVVNPTTKEYTTFSAKGLDGVYTEMGVTLAFDPRKSTHFRLVCICVSQPFTEFEYEDDDEEDEVKRFDLRVYSLENGVVAQVGDTVRIDDTFRPNMDEMKATGVYWNGAIVWLDDMEGAFYNVDEGRFGKFAMPPKVHVEGCDDEMRWIRYAGECSDRFYLICTEGAPTTQVHIYEMERAFSGWSLRFCVDLELVFRTFPESVNPILQPSLYRFMFEVRGIIEVEKDADEEQYLLLAIPGKIIRFNLKDESFAKICDFATEDDVGRCNRSVGDNGSFPIIQSIHPL